MAEPSNAEIARREQWATQENERRQSAYRRADLAWAQDDQFFEWMLATARSGADPNPRQWASSFVAKRGEAVLGVFDDCRLIEIRRGAGSYHGGHAGFSFRLSKGMRFQVAGSRGTYVPGDEQLRITDEGRVVASDRRVVFQGSKTTREWAFGKLLGLQHDPAKPITLIQVSNRQKASGISYPADQTPRVRFALELGAAVATGGTAALIDSISRERDEHTRTRPVPPPVATPAEAPARLARLASGVGALLTGKPGQSPARRTLHSLVAGFLSLFVLTAGLNALAGPSTGVRPAAVAATASQGPPAVPQPVTSPTTKPRPAQSRAPASPTPPAPTIEPDQEIKRIKLGPKPVAPKPLPTKGTQVRVGAECRDGTSSDATGSGACSWHGGVRHWLYEQPAWVDENKAENAARAKKYKSELKKWKAKSERNQLLKDYPCSRGPYPEGSDGYAPWRDTNKNGIACDR